MSSTLNRKFGLGISLSDRRLSGTPAFDPANYQGTALPLSLFLDGNAGTLTDAPAAATAGDPTATQQDQSASGIDVSQSALSKRPIFQRPTNNGVTFGDVVYNGTNQFLSRDNVLAGDLFSTDECYILMVVRQPSSNTVASPFTWAGGGAVVRIYGAYDDVLYFDFTNASGGRTSVGTPVGWKDNFHILECWRESGGVQVIAVDGVALSSVVATGTLDISINGTLYASNDGGGVYFGGDLPKLAVYKQVPSSDVRAYLRAGFADACGITGVV